MTGARERASPHRSLRGDYPSGKQGDVLTVDFTVCGKNAIVGNRPRKRVRS